MSNKFARMPEEPTAEMLGIIYRSDYPSDWELGKEAQRRLGTKVVYPKTEVEIAYGQYRRLYNAIMAENGSDTTGERT